MYITIRTWPNTLVQLLYQPTFILFPDTFGGKVGLAMTQVMGLVMMCQTGMRQTAEVENQMTSVSYFSNYMFTSILLSVQDEKNVLMINSLFQVERICEYSNITSEPPLETDKSKFDHKYPNIELMTWPEEGKY